jgi:conjugal transfer pilus assembly protein TraV
MRRQLRLLAPLTLATMLAGCMTMGGTVKGNFACKAPEGVCAPSSTIDDRALAMIVDASGTMGDRPIAAPAGPYTEPQPAPQRFQQTALDTTRTGERVLRIVFPAQIDGAGRLHEQTAVHAVVEQGDWRQASADTLVATSRQQVEATMGGQTLLAAVVQGDPPITDDQQPDANLPSAAAVEAARAKGAPVRRASADPIGDIKDQVARRMTARPPRLSYNRSAMSAPSAAAAPAQVAPTAASPVVNTPVAYGPARTVRPVPSGNGSASPQPTPGRLTSAYSTPSAPSYRPSAPAGGGTIVPTHATAAGRAAIAAVNANGAVAAGLARAAPEARFAAKGADPVPVLHAAPLPGVDQ